MKKALVCAALILVAMQGVAGATDYYVDAAKGSNTTGDGSKEKPWFTISFALSQITGTGHTVHVAPGIYDTVMDGVFPEIFPFLIRSGISLIGAGADSTIIDPQASNTAIRCENVTNAEIKIEGFRIQNGKGSIAGGITILNANVHVQRNVFDRNEDTLGGIGGGAIYIDDGACTIDQNSFTSNKANSGGAVSVDDGTVFITQNEFIGNNAIFSGAALDISVGSNDTIEISENVFESNIAGFDNEDISIGSFAASVSPLISRNIITSGLKCTNSRPRIFNNTFVGTGNKTAIRIDDASPMIVNNIIANWGNGILEVDATSDPDTLAYNLFFDNTCLYFDENIRCFNSITLLEALIPESANNLEGDPLFVDVENDNFQLLPGSPAINVGDPNSPLDPDGTRADIGAFPFPTIDVPPSAPTNLQAQLGNGHVTLTWTANSEFDFLRYRIYGGTSANPTAKIDSVDGIANTTEIISSLINGTTYFFRITAVDSALQESAFSNEVSATPFTFFTDISISAGVADPGDGRGVTIGDVDNDGDLDIYVANETDPSSLFINNGVGQFENKAGIFGVGGAGDNGQGVAFGDIDNDSDLDLFVASFGSSNRLFLNNGDNTFTDIAGSAGVADPGGFQTRSGVFGDVDNDGYLDLYVVNQSQPNRLYQNNRDNTFTDITSVAGVIDPVSFVDQQAAFADIDNDGNLDLYVAGGGPNLLFRNDGDGTFSEIGQTSNLNDGGNGIGIVFGDIDNDGDLDLYVTRGGQPPQVNRLFRNNGAGVFTEVGEAAGVADPGAGTGTALGDIDNDGDLDLFLVNEAGEQDRLFLNNGSGAFTKVDTVAGIVDAESGRGAALGDFDNDGDLDLYVAVSAGNDRLYRNEIGTSNNYLTIKTVGTVSNRDGIGARVRVVAGSGSQIREVDAGSGYLSQNSLPVEFGLTQATKIDSVIVRWPSGIVQILTDVAVNQVMTITEGTPEVSLNADTLDFGDVTINDTANSVLRITNSGSALLTIDSIAIEGTNEFSFEGQSTFTLGSNESQDITVQFNPTSVGQKNAILKIEHDALDDSTLVDLVGNGVIQPVPVFQISKSALDFGAVLIGGTQDDSLFVHNNGSANLVVSNVPLAGANANEFAILSATNFSVPPNDSVKVAVRFNPISSGSKSASLQITHNASGSPSSIGLSGSGVNPETPVFEISGTALNFGSVFLANAKDDSLVVRNEGLAELAVTDISLAGANADEFALISETNFNVLPDESSKVVIRFSPTTSGSKSASLRITHNAAGSPSILSLDGVGTAVDSQAPEIASINFPANVNFGTSINVSASVSDNVFVQEVRLLFREGGQSAFQSVVLTAAAGNHQGQIPSEVVGKRGVEFLIEAIDTSNNTSRSALSAVLVRMPAGVLEHVHNGGDRSTFYRLRSMPLAMNDPSVLKNLVLPVSANYHKNRLRIFDVDPTNALSSRPFREFSMPPPADFSELSSGESVFYITRENVTLRNGDGITVNTVEPFLIILRPGWNMFASPFAFKVARENIDIGGIDSEIVTHNENGYVPVIEGQGRFLEPFEGYLIFNNFEQQDTLIIHPSEVPLALPPLTLKPTVDADWFIDIKAQCEYARDNYNTVGIIADAEMEWDHYERYEPPPIGAYVSVNFPRNKWQTKPNIYRTDFRPQNSDGYVWGFEVETNFNGEAVTLDFGNLESLPSNFEIRLEDVTLGQKVDLANNPQYIFSSSPSGKVQEFRIVAGISDFVEENAPIAAEIPETFELVQNFPNPFNPSTTIQFGLPQSRHVVLKIYNLLGQEVATLLDGVQKIAGNHIVVWDGRDQVGQAVSSGIYLYELRSDNVVLTRRMTLLK
jgi:hypothetical protein